MLNTILGASLSILKFEIRQLGRQNYYIIKAPFFFLMMVTLFPLAIGPDPALIGKMSTGILILSLLLACLFPVNHFFENDHEDRTLEQILTSHVPLGLYIFLKMVAHWIMAAGPLVLLSPLLALSLEGAAPMAVLWAVIPASMLFVLIGVLGAALTVGTRHGGVLLALVVLPLYIPVVIFASFAAQMGAGQIGMETGAMAPGDIANAQAAYYFLYAGLAVAIPLVPVICAGILKMIME